MNNGDPEPFTGELPSRPARWRPWWATVIALLFGLPTLAVFGMGVYAALNFARADVGMSWLAAWLGVVAAVAALPALVPFVIYLVRGGRFPVALEVAYVLMVGVFVWLVIPGAGSFGWFGYVPIR
jgi:hypothetical protein